MNILPKKSWHVLSKDNIQRVRRDEAAAKAEEEERQQRAALAEREAQLGLMRKRAREREGLSDEPTTSSAQTDRHVNFFADLQQGVGVQQLSNKEHDQEVAQEKEKFEKKIGLLNYLVDKSKSDDPWYVTQQKTEESKKSHQRKELMDPLNDMKKYLGEKRKSSDKDSFRWPAAEKKKRLEPARSSPNKEAAELHHRKSSDHKHSHKKHKHKAEKKDKESTLEKLRKERMKREEAEKLKSEALLRQHYGVPESEKSSGSVDTSSELTERPRKYNSQFNPSLARY